MRKIQDREFERRIPASLFGQNSEGAANDAARPSTLVS